MKAWEIALDSPRPRLLFSQQAWQQMMQYIWQCDVEINGYGLVDRQLDGTLYVSRVFILDQTATEVSVESSGEALAAYASAMIASGDNPSRIRLQWHSHVHMPAYFSTTDQDNIERYGNGSDWMINLVANKRGEFSARLDVYRPFRMYCDLQYEVEMPKDSDIAQQCADDIRSKVTRRGIFRPKAMTPLTDDSGSVSTPAEYLR
jgi:hypothetical protein